MVSTIPKHPKIYHITHVDNLPRIIECGRLLSDEQRLQLQQDTQIVGIENIKQARLMKSIPCHPGTTVGQFVPFYFCPRSIMLYILYKGNHPDLKYRGGQRPIIHLQADMKAAVEGADLQGKPWAFTDANARASYAKFYCDLSDLDGVNWHAVAATDWQDAVIQEDKQAEFLVHESFPWELVEKIGVYDAGIKTRIEEALGSSEHKPLVTVKRDWYY